MADMKKLADALRKASDMSYALPQGDLNAVRRVLTSMQESLSDAADACEEEGEAPASIAWVNEHDERIAALEAKTVSPHATHALHGPGCGCVLPPPGATAPTPAGVAPEEEHKSKLYERMGKIWAAAASPEQAQERTPHPRETCRALDPPCVSCAPPEQARRTATFRISRYAGESPSFKIKCGNYDDYPHDAYITMTELRPGERIISGEGVRDRCIEIIQAHKLSTVGSDMEDALLSRINAWLDNIVERIREQIPDAPPRAEEK